MSDQDEDACVRNIVKEIMRECNSKKININNNFVTFLTKLLLLDPNWGIGSDFFEQRKNVQHFVKYMMNEMICRQYTATVVTLKTQFYFTCNIENIYNTIKLNRNDLKNRLKLLHDDIQIYDKVDNKKNIDIFYKKIIYYISFLSGLGNPGNPRVYEEVRVVLKSILNEEELKEFTKMQKKEKQIQLEYLMQVVSGIRLFNKYCDKGGQGIASLPNLIPKAVNNIQESNDAVILFIMEKVNLLTIAIEKSYALKSTYKGYQVNLQNTLILNESLRQPDIRYLQNLLIFFKQYELIIKRIQEELIHIKKRSRISLRKMEALIKTIHETVSMKIGVLADVVFPLFQKLWSFWENFQNETFVMTRLNEIMSNLYIFSKQTRFHKFDIIIEKGDAKRITSNLHLCLLSKNPDIKVIHNYENAENYNLQYLGHCCWMLVETDGALIPGNISLGIVEYKHKYYVFSCYEAYYMFSKDPEMYINSVLELCRRHPQLINLFRIQKNLEKYSNIKNIVTVKIKVKSCEDKYVQTINDFEPYIDHDYKWNVWDLKREALTKANLLGYTTVTTQTNKTNSQNNIRTQTYNTERQVACQTPHNKSTNVPKPSIFLHGLRDRQCNKQCKIDLTLFEKLDGVFVKKIKPFGCF